ncbi:filamentous hemagglutinin N-terminal domain-containing protein, partial [Bartonella raoultii]|uniref:filamentous hemagglutinin N-terminal domain-containing protein n=1 Tax=Bartonella raoultii TaxID=1457020 RepID=UPI001ABA52EA
IVTPNSSGLSHNKYYDFNIGHSGVIWNNHASEVGQSQLGGIMPGNPHLRVTGSAKVILNEVTSGNRSALNGPGEVFGRPADVIIANPNGISCDGCGFINTPHATLTTGVPEIDVSGSLKGFVVKGGDITFGAKGANFFSGQGAIDIVDIVSRTVHLEGPIAGREIGMTAGTGSYDYASREMKELTDITGKPEYAIDGSALGALQGDQIKLVATEKGVGVRMRHDMAANAGQLHLSADGKISLQNA